ncbi:monovalent cation/H(+) antiporter subunit G [Anaerobacillus isosaccharinicus]|uniref:Na+/H+ antiporter subunit G n=1 Tax=Anaerobacillus isosaccharinicus TaxID=1532552 RepID=A0A1S2LR92_9BACI|nr:monovalent cation/H(+) antiporter subunit G [Anaerobacillus isosaccharinicus]MBA5585453.1 Na+/H+ antiporter subunit G [Anaerobacillus isosaccharinicus]QOY36229.1 Na+/H+ antiporter subunit G [Anaerobacillus isosaccharinicus]
MIEIVISAFILLGAFLSLLGSIGILRFPDVYGRLHAATKSATLGVISIMLAVYVHFHFIEGVFSGKVLLTIFFVFLTAPVAGFMISRSAYNVGVELWDKSTQDDLKIAFENKEKNKKKARS